MEFENRRDWKDAKLKMLEINPIPMKTRFNVLLFGKKIRFLRNFIALALQRVNVIPMY